MSIYYMGPVSGLPEASRQEVEDYLRRNADGVTLGTVQEDGPRLTMMGLLQGAGLDELYMQTTRGSQKAQNLLTYPTAEIAVSDKQGYVVLTCTAKVLDGAELKAAKWEDWMAQYHPQRPSAPDYVLLRFVPQSIRAMF